jgi:lysophospholipase-3
MLPDPEFWGSTVLVQTPQRNYTVADFPELFNDLGTPITNTIYQKISGVQSEIAAPAVELHCLYGNNMPTEMGYIYNNGWDKDPQIIYSNDGDGVVPEVSLKKCQDFAKQQTQPVEVKEFDLASHMTVLDDEELLQYVLKVVTVTK